MTLVLFLLAVLVGLGALALMRARQIYRRDGHWAFLVTRIPWTDRTLSEANLDDMPPAARRWLVWAIGKTTPLRPVAVIASSRQSRIAPGCTLSCRQVLAFPHGAVWRLRWTRFGLPAALSMSSDPTAAEGTAWHAGLVTGRRAGSVAAQAMLAAQCAAEAALWTPAAFVNAAGVTMEESGPSMVAVTWEAGGTGFRMEIEMAPDGEPLLATVTSGSLTLVARPSGFEDREGTRVARAIALETREGSEQTPFALARLETIRHVGPFIGHSHA